MYLEKKQHTPIHLKFSVTGKPVVLINVIDTGLALKIYIERALNESGSARPMEDYNVFYNSLKLDSSKKTASFKFPDKAVIMLSLKSAQGANSTHTYDKHIYHRTICKRYCCSNYLSNRKI